MTIEKSKNVVTECPHLHRKAGLHRGWFIAAILIAMLQLPCAAAQKQKDPVIDCRSLRSMGRLYMAYGEYQKAEPFLKSAMIKSRQLVNQDREKALCFLDMASLYSGQEQYTMAADLYRRGLSFQKTALSEYHPYVAYTMRNLATVYLRQGQNDKASEMLTEARQIMLRTHSAKARELIPFDLDQADLLTRQDDLDGAQQIYERVYGRVQQEYKRDHLYTAQVQEKYAALCIRTGQINRAQELIDSSLETQTKVYGSKSRMLVSVWLTKARICQACQDNQSMQTYLDKAVSVVEKSRDVIAVARLYQQIEKIRTSPIILASAGQVVAKSDVG